MFYRRKILLALLGIFDGQLTAKSLQKLLFLFTRMQEKKAYDFVPYKYGCFSFQANQDLLTMQKYDLVEIGETSNGRYIRLKSKEDYISELKPSDKKALHEIKNKFDKLSQNDLIKYTYQHYPYYAINSSIAENMLTQDEIKKINQQRRKYDTPTLFTIGYEGITLETYINKLIINDIRILCDVRKNAFSQKYGFSKNQLKTACEGVGIKYIHIPELGINSNKRVELNTQADYDKLFEHYKNTNLPNNQTAILQLQELINKEIRIALTCFEKDPKQCHRTCVARALMNLPKINYKLKEL